MRDCYEKSVVGCVLRTITPEWRVRRSTNFNSSVGCVPRTIIPVERRARTTAYLAFHALRVGQAHETPSTTIAYNFPKYLFSRQRRHHLIRE